MDRTRSALEGVERPANVLAVPAGVHHDVEHPIPVQVRLVWASGPQWIAGSALEWTHELVRVETRDQRLMPRVVWVRAVDVRRR